MLNYNHGWLTLSIYHAIFYNFQMLLTLASGSANHVWEHKLLDPSKADSHQSHVKKPGPKDPLE